MVNDMEQNINLFYSTELLKYGLLYWIKWQYELHPNLAILGNSGSGKSMLIRLIAAKAVLIPDSRLWVCDYKNELLSTAEPRYWGYTDVIHGLENFKKIFEKRLTGEDKSNSFCLLIIDEYPAWLASMDKKQAEEVKKDMARLLFMVRSKNMHIVLGAQRCMAENFSFGARDCLNSVFLGSPSKESLHSFMSAEDAKIIKPCGRGAGYMAFDGLPIKAITVPVVRDFEKLEQAIIDGVSR
jgi:adenylate kinase family enzyme